jgi:hypothetical protein
MIDRLTHPIAPGSVRRVGRSHDDEGDTVQKKITVADLTIRQLKVIGRGCEVSGFSKMDKPTLLACIDATEHTPEAIQAMVDTLLAPEGSKAPKAKKAPKANGKSEAASDEAKLDAIRRIAKAGSARMKAEDKLRSVREQLNKDVASAKASHQGVFERSVDYDDKDAVTSKLEDLTMAWQTLEDAKAQRIEELAPLKSKLKAAKKEERAAYEDSKQLRIKF